MVVEVEKSGSLARLRAFHRDPLGFFVALQQRYGPRVRFRMGPWDFFLLTDPSSVGAVLSHHQSFFHKGPGLDPNNPLIGRGLLTSEGDAWVSKRRRLAPVFTRRNIERMQPTLASIVNQELDRWESGQWFDLEARLLRLSLTFAVRTLFADDSTGHKAIEEAGQAVQWLMAHFYRRSRSIWRFPYHIPGSNRRYHARERKLHSFIRNLEPHPRPFESVWPGLTENDPERLEEIATLVVAGFETTGHAMAWAIHQLAQDEAAEERVLEEGHQGAHRLWTEAVLKESLRLYPPVWLLSRRAIQDAPVVDDMPLPEGSFILLSPWIMHRNPDTFPDPDRFDPRRWLAGSDTLPPYAYIPFGAGPRRCIGEHLAQTEATLVIGEIVQRFRVRIQDPHPAIFPGLTLASQNGLMVMVEKRLH
ncbi:cytochrome P450 [Sulfobacillus harzensis]|uniref:Cytochrome P450 n=1 Tax=Sulfobacillus harzensis TaxID=2729629 RepID=A0A7Y0Q2C5_9FIRM|nr:cytochrome P450 [Sulfobacillus harzensis]